MKHFEIIGRGSKYLKVFHLRAKNGPMGKIWARAKNGPTRLQIYV
jgi:hypothetical protein